jgi:secondary thiamine-phosphate synthase enzyme
MLKEINIRTEKREVLIDITNKIKSLLKQIDITDGVCKIYIPHTTAGVTINENADPSVKDDIINQLREFVPKNAGYSHREGNADAHIKSTLTGSSVDILIHKGELVLGTWQGIMFAEYDGPRSRKAYVQIQGE